MDATKFEQLAATDVSRHAEKKGGFSYLSWPYAVAELRKVDPAATWTTTYFDGKPYCQTEAGCFVEVELSACGITQKHIHPVLDNRNKPIAKPSCFDINSSIMRCLVKVIAIATGLGLYIYAGEDLPEVEKPKPTPSIPPEVEQAGKRIMSALPGCQYPADVDDLVQLEGEFIDRMPPKWKDKITKATTIRREELTA